MSGNGLTAVALVVGAVMLAGGVLFSLFVSDPAGLAGLVLTVPGGVLFGSALFRVMSGTR